MLKNGTILVIDDSPADRELILHCMRLAGVQAPVQLLGDGAEALAYLKGQPPFDDRDRYPYPCMVITDLKMPVVDGLGLLEFLRNHPELAVIPTIVLSGSSDADDVEVSYLLGASSYIVKPPTASELCDRIRTMMEYWCHCEAPITTRTGMHIRTEAHGKIGERYSRSPFPPARAGPASA
ncbi:response regulator [Opitutus terrae]|uniref:Response regulator receiver protein n=1 Tax=Opitutus terrae (strain DSM 11246 / JCM 15787 / PB90-1) TaxID=452637 RepID=B1ZN90_OPITP|nr:response regulator [Opitutus terrae]ACB73459.1 response regulator receiver protein [Opitutus terrae PB90-1]